MPEKEHQTFLERAITDGYANPDEQVRAEFWAELNLPKHQYGRADLLVSQMAARQRRPTVLEREANIIADLPRIYGKPEEYRFYKGDPNNDIQPVSKEALIGAIKKCHQTLWAGGKFSPLAALWIRRNESSPQKT